MLHPVICEIMLLLYNYAALEAFVDDAQRGDAAWLSSKMIGSTPKLHATRRRDGREKCYKNYVYLYVLIVARCASRHFSQKVWRHDKDLGLVKGS